MSGNQSDLYKHVEAIEYLGDLVGADKAADQLKINLVESDHTPTVDVMNRDGRTLGTVSVDALPEPVTTDLAEALASNANDSVRVSLEANNAGLAADSTLSSTLSREIATWSAGTVAVAEQNALEIGTWNAGTLAVAEQNALTIGAWNAGTLAVQENTPLDVSGATVPVEHQGVIDVSSRDARNLGDVDVTALPDSDAASRNATALAADATASDSLAAQGAETLRGRVARADTAYDVTVQWEDADGNVLFIDTVAAGVAAGSETALDESAISPYCTVNVSDAGAASGAVTATYHLR